MPPKTCDICNKSPARLNKIFDQYLCEECRETPDYKLIYKTTAKNKYFLNEKDIEQLECFETTGSNGFSHHCAVTLIREFDAINYFCEKHHITLDQLNETIESLKTAKENKSNKIKQTKQMKLENRKRDLQLALKKVGLKLRPDSKLCEGYIDGTIKDWSIDQIVHRMCQMHFLYNYGNMDYHLEKSYKYQTEELNAGFFPDMTVPEQAEMHALEEIGGYPKKWPWLEKPNKMLTFYDLALLNNKANQKSITINEGLALLNQLEHE